MKLLSLLLLFILTTASSWAQQNAIKILVVDEFEVPLDYFNVVVMNPSDSSYMTGNVYYSGNFDCRDHFTGRKILKFISLGYKDHFLDIDFDSPVFPDKIVMQTDAFGIGEVVVLGSRAAIKVDRGKTILQVSGSSLVHLSDITAIMSRAPGVKATDSELTVLGRGEPLVYIDGRKGSYSELKILQPVDILSIEIDRSPSARYDASAKAVIRVKTRRATDGISGRINTGVDIARRTSPTAGGQLQINTPKLYTFAGLDFAAPWYNSKSEYNQAIVLPEYAMTDSSFTKTLDKYISTNFLYNSILTTSLRSKLSWQYRLNYRKVNTDESVNEKIEGIDIPFENIVSTKIGKDIMPNHKFNVGYQVDFDSFRKLEIFGDYAFMSRDKEQNINQLNTDTNEITGININNTSNSDVASIRSEYTTQIAELNLLLGTSYGFINSRNSTDYGGELFNTKIISNTVALYSTLGNEYKKWGYEIGLRYEYLGDKLLLTDSKQINRVENKLFPSAEIHTNGFLNSLDMSLNYSSHTSRPSLNSLNPTKSYINKVTIAQGNPNLLSAVYHNIALNLTMWQTLSLDLEYNIGLNNNIETGILAEDKKTVIFTPVNIARATDFNLMLSYVNEWKFFSLSLSAMVLMPDYRVPYMDGYYNNNIISYDFKIAPGFKISKNTNLSLSYNYTSRTAELMTIWEPAQDLSVDFSQYLFKRRIQIVASATNLLNKSNSPWHDKMGYFECYDRTDRDTRRFKISLRYRFNNFQSKYKGYRESEQNSRVN